MHLARAFAPLLLLALPLAAAERSFAVDRNHTVLGFKASTLLFEVPGRFGRYKVDIAGDPDAPSSVKVRVEVNAASIDTSNPTRTPTSRAPTSSTRPTSPSWCSLRTRPGRRATR